MPHTFYEWTEKDTTKNIRLLDIPESTGRRKRMIEAIDRVQERKRKILSKWSK